MMPEEQSQTSVQPIFIIYRDDFHAGNGRNLRRGPAGASHSQSER